MPKIDFELLEGSFTFLGPINSLQPQRTLKKGRHFSVERETNLFNAAMHPVSFLDFLSSPRVPHIEDALDFSGLASIPRLLTMKPKNFPALTVKVHLFRLSIMLVCQRMKKV